jgi:hypothetical protein
MTQTIENSELKKGLPIDERPIIIVFKDKPSINYIGRYIEKEGLFMLSLNDDDSDFIFENDNIDWCYVNEHPIIINEILSR